MAGPMRERVATIRAPAIDLGAVNSWLLAGVFFLIPMQVAPAYVLSATIFVLWLIDGRLPEKARALAAEPLVWIFVGYYAVLLASMLWTENADWGWRMVRRQNFFLLFPLYLSVARREHFGRYIGAFLLSIALCELLVLYNWGQMHWWPTLPEGIRVHKDPHDTAPFIDRIMYAPVLALAGYLAAHRVLFDAPTWRERMVYGALMAATTLNLLIGGGRAGVVGFLVLIAMVTFQRLARRPVLAAVGAVALALAVVLAGYQGSDYFRDRVDAAIDQATHYEQRVDSSVATRIVFARNSWRMFAEHPWFGVGIGDYPHEYERIRATRTPNWMAGNWNPHNQYLYALTAAGVPGGVLIALVLFVPLWRRAPAEDARHRIRRALPLLLITICVFESYLMRSNISMMYSLFTAACWCGASARASCSAS